MDHFVSKRINLTCRIDLGICVRSPSQSGFNLGSNAMEQPQPDHILQVGRSYLATVLLSIIAVPLLARSQAPQPRPAPPPAIQTIPDDTIIILQRGNCEGGCPVYRVIIFSDGDVIWHGQDHVAKTGLILSHIEPNQIRALLADFEAMDYFNLQHIYGYGGKGCPRADIGKVMTRTTLVTGGRSQTVPHYAGCSGTVSDQLSAIEMKIDQTLNTTRWITGKPPAKSHAR